MCELMKMVAGFRDYFVTDTGIVYSNKTGSLKKLRVDPQPVDYKTVILYSDDGKRKTCMVHRLVAKAWLPNPANLPFVNHKDGNKQNNNKRNLEYVTATENCKHSREVLGNNGHVKPVCKMDKKGTLLDTYKSIADAALANKVAANCISAVCLGKSRTCGGFLWCYEVDFKKDVPIKKHKASKKVDQYTPTGEFLRSFPSIKDAAEYVGVKYNGISGVLSGKAKTSGGFIWKLAEKEKTTVQKDKMKGWRELKGFPLYKISRTGEVFSTWGKKIKKPAEDRRGYMRHALTNGTGICKHMPVHRIVAMVYIPNPDNLPCVNHIDGDKKNNNVDNLEWCSYSHNSKHAYDTGLNKNTKAVIQMDKISGKIIKKYSSMKEAEDATKIPTSDISKTCKNSDKSAGGYKWKLA